MMQRRGSFFIKMEGTQEKEISMRDLLKMRNSILEDDGEGQLDEEKVSRFLQRKSISVKGKIPMID